MRRSNLFWGLILIVLGVLFFLHSAGLIDDVFAWFWPLAIILVGLFVLFGRYLPRRSGLGEHFSIDLQGAARLDLNIDHGAGSVFVSGGAPEGVALTGSQGAGLEVSSHLLGDSLAVKLSAGPSFLPFIGPEGGEWHFQLTQAIPVAIKLDAGASSLDLDLTDVRLTSLGIDAGASSLKINLPASAGHSLVDIETGAASIDLHVPSGVGARIRFDQGASSISVDEQRFPAVASMRNLFQSADFDGAPNKVEINLAGGANSVSVR